MVERDYSHLIEKWRQLYKKLEKEGVFDWVPNRPEWNERDLELYHRKRKEVYRKVLDLIQNKNFERARREIISLIDWEIRNWEKKARYYHREVLGLIDVEEDVEFLKKIDRLEKLQNSEVLTQEVQKIVEQRKQEIENQLKKEAELNQRKKQLIMQNVVNLGGNQTAAKRMIQKRIDEPFKQKIEQKNQELQEFAQQVAKKKVEEAKTEIKKILKDFFMEYKNNYLQEIYARRRRYRDEDRRYFQKLREKLKNAPIDLKVGDIEVQVKIDEAGEYLFRLKDGPKNVWYSEGAFEDVLRERLRELQKPKIQQLKSQLTSKQLTPKDAYEYEKVFNQFFSDSFKERFQVKALDKNTLQITKIEKDTITVEKPKIIVDEIKLKAAQLKKQYPFLFSSYKEAYRLIGKTEEEVERMAIKATEGFLKDMKKNPLLRFSVGFAEGFKESHYMVGIAFSEIVKNPKEGTKEVIEGTYEYFKDLATNPNFRNVGNFIGWTAGSILPTSKVTNKLAGAFNIVVNPLEGMKTKTKTKTKEKVKGNAITQREYIEWLKEKILEGNIKDIKKSVEKFLENLEKQYKEGKITKEQYERQKALLVGSIYSALLELGVKLEMKKKRMPQVKVVETKAFEIKPLKLEIKTTQKPKGKTKVEIKPFVPTSLQKEIQKQITKEKSKIMTTYIKTKTDTITIPRQIQEEITKTRQIQEIIQLPKKIEIPTQKTIQIQQTKPDIPINPIKVPVEPIKIPIKPVVPKVPRMLKFSFNTFIIPKNRKRKGKYDYFELNLPIPRAFKDLKI